MPSSVPIPHGRSCRGSDITIRVGGKWMVRSANNHHHQNGGSNSMSLPQSKTTVLKSTLFNVHTNMTLSDFREKVATTFNLPSNASKANSFRLSVPRMMNHTKIQDYLNRKNKGFFFCFKNFFHSSSFSYLSIFFR